MDTDDLTEMAYRTITLAYDVSENLRAELGALAMRFSSEDEYLHGVVKFLDAILDDPEDYLDGWNALEETDVPKFVDGVRGLRDHATRTLGTSQSQRGGTPFG